MGEHSAQGAPDRFQQRDSLFDMFSHFHHFCWCQAGRFVQEVPAGFELAHVMEQACCPDIVDMLLVKSHAGGNR